MYIYIKVRNFFIFIIAVGYIIFEELFWVRIAKPIYNYISTYHLYESFLNYVKTSMNKYIILVLFLMLFVVSELLGPVAIGYLFSGKIVMGIIVYILKMFPLIVAFAIFENGKEKLFSFQWFKYSYDFIMMLIDKLKSSSVFINIKLQVHSFKEKILILIKSEKKNLHKELFNEAKESIKSKINK